MVDTKQIDLSQLGGSSIRNDVVYVGDVLQVKAATGAEEDETEPWELRVGADGTIGVPLVGPVQVAGLPVIEAEKAVQRASFEREIFVDPAVSVLIKKHQMNSITIQGAVEQPGTYELPVANSNLVAALFAAGGLQLDAEGTVDIKPPEGNAAQPIRINLLSTIPNGEANVYVDDGTILMVNKQPERFIHVIGLIGNKSIALPSNRNVRLLDALSLAGGPTFSPWISDRVNIIRKDPHSDRSVTIKLSIRKAKRDLKENILLAAQDVVSVEENLITFTLSTMREIVGIGATAAQGAAAAAP